MASNVNGSQHTLATLLVQNKTKGLNEDQYNFVQEFNTTQKQFSRWQTVLYKVEPTTRPVMQNNNSSDAPIGDRGVKKITGSLEKASNQIVSTLCSHELIVQDVKMASHELTQSNEQLAASLTEFEKISKMGISAEELLPSYKQLQTLSDALKEIEQAETQAAYGYVQELRETNLALMQKMSALETGDLSTAEEVFTQLIANLSKCDEAMEKVKKLDSNALVEKCNCLSLKKLVTKDKFNLSLEEREDIVNNAPLFLLSTLTYIDTSLQKLSNLIARISKPDGKVKTGIALGTVEKAIGVNLSNLLGKLDASSESKSKLYIILNLLASSLLSISYSSEENISKSISKLSMFSRALRKIYEFTKMFTELNTAQVQPLLSLIKIVQNKINPVLTKVSYNLSLKESALKELPEQFEKIKAEHLKAKEKEAKADKREQDKQAKADKKEQAKQAKAAKK